MQGINDSKFLVPGQEATDFLELSVLDAGLGAMLGDPKMYDAMVGPDIVGSHTALREAAKKVIGLVDDPTRTEVDKHAVAKKLADGVTEKLTKARAAIQKRADDLMQKSLASAETEFGPRQDRAALHTEIRTWVRDTLQRKGGEGIGIIRQAMKGNKDLADVVYHSPRFLLGDAIPGDVYEEMRMEAIEAHKPELYASLNQSVSLTTLAKKYDNAIRKVGTTFYSPSIAKRAAKRVEV